MMRSRGGLPEQRESGAVVPGRAADIAACGNACAAFISG